MAAVTQKWQTICTVGFGKDFYVKIENQNPEARGGVTFCQARRGKEGLLGRYVNSTGFRREERGEAFPLSAEVLSSWEMIERSSR